MRTFQITNQMARSACNAPANTEVVVIEGSAELPSYQLRRGYGFVVIVGSEWTGQLPKWSPWD